MKRDSQPDGSGMNINGTNNNNYILDNVSNRLSTRSNHIEVVEEKPAYEEEETPKDLENVPKLR